MEAPTMLDPLNPLIDPGNDLPELDGEDAAAPDDARAHVRQHPDLVAQAGDLGRHAEEKLIALICSDDQKATACLREKLDQMRAELGHVSDPPMLRSLTNRVVLDWLWLHFLDLTCATMEDGPRGAKIELTRKREAAHRMYLAAMKMHATFAKSLRRRRQVTHTSN
jgi:hypothetical protein